MGYLIKSASIIVTINFIEVLYLYLYYGTFTVMNTPWAQYEVLRVFKIGCYQLNHMPGVYILYIN